jgi:hypothetical protein
MVGVFGIVRLRGRVVVFKTEVWARAAGDMGLGRWKIIADKVSNPAKGVEVSGGRMHRRRTSAARV